MTSLPGAECGIGVELFDMCYRVRLDHSHFTVLLLDGVAASQDEVTRWRATLARDLRALMKLTTLFG